MIPDIDGFVVEAEIGRGGFGIVYRARQLAFNRLVAIKVLHASGTPAAKVERQFAKECLAVGALRSHAHILRVYSTGLTRDGAPYLAMELLTGGPLSARIPLAPEAVRVLGVKLAGALQIAHDGGVVHRDVKPGNVLFNDDDEPVLVDFGISAIVGEASTTTGSVAISIGYTPPEVLEGAGPAVPADVYALGATLYAAACGRTPFVPTGGYSSIGVVAARILNAPVEDLRPEGVPDWLCRVIEKAMTKDPAERYPTMAAMQQALREAGEADTVRVADSPWRGTKPMPAEPEARPNTRTRPLGPRKRRRVLLAGLGVLVVAAGVVTAVVAAAGGDAHPSAGTRRSNPPVTVGGAPAYGAADLNCDGQDDFLAVDKTQHDELVFWPRKGRDWGNPYHDEPAGNAFGKYKTLLLPGNMIGDRSPDLVGQEDDGSLFLIPGHCNGRFDDGQAVQLTLDAGQVTAAGDLNGDGHPDLLSVDGQGRLFLLAGTGAGRVKPARLLGSGWTSAIGVGDLNGDGFPDVIDRHGDGTLRLFESDGHGRWNAATRAAPGGLPLALKLPPRRYPLLIGDANVFGDKRSDLVAATVPDSRKGKTGVQLADLLAFVATGGDVHPQYATTCVRLGNGWAAYHYPVIANGVAVPATAIPKTQQAGGPPFATCPTTPQITGG